MKMETITIKGLVQSINAIVQFINNHNCTLESPQSGQLPIQMIPTPFLPEESTYPSHGRLLEDKANKKD